MSDKKDEASLYDRLIEVLQCKTYRDQLTIGKITKAVGRPIGAWYITCIGDNYRLWVKAPNKYRTDGPVVVAGFSMVPTISCRKAVLFCQSYVAASYQNLGLGTALHELRIEACRRWGAGMVYCTVDSQNEAQTKILLKHGWKLVERFTNSDTGAYVGFWLREVQ